MHERGRAADQTATPGLVDHRGNCCNLEVLILVSGYRVLIWETHPSDDARVSVPEYGSLDSGSLVCHCFNRRGVVFRVFYYSPNNMMGRDACPFVLSKDE